MMSGHLWTRWKYDHALRRWFRHCVIGGLNCTGLESVPRGGLPKGAKR